MLDAAEANTAGDMPLTVGILGIVPRFLSVVVENPGEGGRSDETMSTSAGCAGGAGSWLPVGAEVEYWHTHNLRVPVGVDRSWESVAEPP